MIEKIAKTATNFFIEDWNDKIIPEFETTLKALVSDLQQREEAASRRVKKSVFRLTTESKNGFMILIRISCLLPESSSRVHLMTWWMNTGYWIIVRNWYSYEPCKETDG